MLEDFDDRIDFLKSLSATARGNESADLVIRNSSLVNVYSGEILEESDVAIKGSRIALVGSAGHTVGENTEIIDAEGEYLAPGFLDGHVHIDDSMGTVREFAKVVLPRGTTGVFMDPHEIANVLGLDGVKLMVEESKNIPLRVFTSIPSCVPATNPNFETSGGIIGVEEVKEALQWEETVALGEVMDYPSVIRGEGEILSMIRETQKAGKVVEGHAPAVSGRELNAYISAGITSCHESTEEEEALEKLRLGMYPMIREGFASIKNLQDLIGIVTDRELDSNRICLVTDDRHPEDLVEDGHMDDVVSTAIREGVDPIEAIQMGTINPAKHFQLDEKIGGIAPGKYADMILLSDLQNLEISQVISNGEVVARNGNFVGKMETFEYPDFVENTVRIPRKLKPKDFEIGANRVEGKEVKVRVIGVKEETPKTKELERNLPVQDGIIKQDSEKDIAKIAVVERHKESGNIGLGFVTGFGFEKGATASTIGHDSHNLLVIGTNNRDMSVATNRLAEVGGGIITVSDAEVQELLELPIGGLMTDTSLEKIKEKMEGMREVWDKFGCDMDSPFSTMILLPLPVLPELRVSDKGLIDTVNFEIVDVQLTNGKGMKK